MRKYLKGLFIVLIISILFVGVVYKESNRKKYEVTENVEVKEILKLRC